MADVRCPMCGKPNPEELETCQFCQARLKPLQGQYPGEEADLPKGLEFSRGSGTGTLTQSMSGSVFCARARKGVNPGLSMRSSSRIG